MVDSRFVVSLHTVTKAAKIFQLVNSTQTFAQAEVKFAYPAAYKHMVPFSFRK